MNPFCKISSFSTKVAGVAVMLLATLTAGCGGGGLDPILGTPGAGRVPTVTATSPVASTPIVTGVASNVRVSATFSEAMLASTITNASFTLTCPAATPVAASVAYDAATQTATLTPNAALPANTPCQASVAGTVQDSTGIAMGAAFVWNFLTAPAAPVDTTRPTVSFKVPAAAATGVASNTAISATFTEAMNPATITGSSFTVANTTLGTPVTGTVSYVAASQTAIFTPTAPATLDSSSLFTVTITSAATDLAGNALAGNLAVPPGAGNHVWTFTTGAASDTTRPTVTLTLPAAAATGVATNTAISASFSEAMNPATFTNASFTVTNTTLGTPVAGTVSYAAGSSTAVFTPTAPATLANSSLYTVTVTTAATDLAGNALAVNFIWSFTTAAAPDTTRPTVTLTVPVAGATAVAANTGISASFSEAMNPATINGANFILTNTTLGTAVTGTVSYAVGSRTATFTPSSPGGLAASSQFTATLTSAATDLAGNALAGNTAVAQAAGNHVWSFTTGAAPDTTRPTVTVTVPAGGATGVANNTAVTATFSEAMNASSLSSSSFTLINTTLGTAVPGTVSYAAGSMTATFAPAAVLASGSLFTATVTTAATDLAGNSLAGNTATAPSAGNHVWTFTTGATGDTTPPTVTEVSPPDLSAGVCLTRPISATFSEPMDPATISAATFGVSDNGVAVAGSVSYNAASRVATFVPNAAAGFAASRSFTVTVLGGSAGVKDLAGNALAAPRVWSFSTGTQPCLGPVELGSIASFGAFGGAAGVTNQGITTAIGGNIGSTAACTLITGLHDASNGYTETPLNIGAVNGSVYCAPPAPGTAATLAIATQARADAQTAYNTLAALPPGSDPGAGQLGGLVLAPGVYTSAGGTFAITSANLTLDARGDANAVWVFQSAAALTVGLSATPRSVLLINGAQAKNVFWQVGSAARIEDGSTMVGTIIAPAGVTISTAGQTVQTTLIGRAIGLTASVTLVNVSIVAP
ncbi:Ig-like domain-containing protein [Roseateles sp.]|uniref:Ig-like domain-containing protein n=1 Tax=Roseateles sp. TaxID=1971397 RepID=UPI00286B913B|nr:Ig-like domain-containing protein [Roseateles sp.]